MNFSSSKLFITKFPTQGMSSLLGIDEDQNTRGWHSNWWNFLKPIEKSMFLFQFSDHSYILNYIGIGTSFIHANGDLHWILKGWDGTWRDVLNGSFMFIRHFLYVSQKKLSNFQVLTGKSTQSLILRAGIWKWATWGTKNQWKEIIVRFSWSVASWQKSFTKSWIDDGHVADHIKVCRCVGKLDTTCRGWSSLKLGCF